MASKPSFILSVTILTTISIGQRAVPRIPFCCAGDSLLDINTHKCVKLKNADGRMFMFPGQSEPLSEEKSESVKSITFSQINFQSNGEIDLFDVSLAIPKETLTKKFNCEFRNSRLVHNFTNLNSDEEQVLFDGSTMETHDHYCIDVVKTNTSFNTVGLVCDPCTNQKPCVSVCTNSAKEFSKETPDGNFTRVSISLPCSTPLTLSSGFFSFSSDGFVKVHDLNLGYKDYCLLDTDNLNVCKNTILKNETISSTEVSISTQDTAGVGHSENMTDGASSNRIRKCACKYFVIIMLFAFKLIM